MKLIPLSRGFFAKVDDEDYDFLMQWKWYAHTHTVNKLTYAIRNIPAVNGGKRTAVKMHRAIMGLTDPKIVVDHVDHDGLNNQRSNLRTCTHAQNSYNKTGQGLSKYLGVSFFRLKKLKDGSINPQTRWRGMIIKEGKRHCLGIYKTEEEAARAYDKKAIELFGEFANLNFKQSY